MRIQGVTERSRDLGSGRRRGRAATVMVAVGIGDS